MNVITPDDDALHQDHFHLDLGLGVGCKLKPALRTVKDFLTGLLIRRSLNWRYQGNKKPQSKRMAVCVLFKVLIDIKGLVARKLINGI